MEIEKSNQELLEALKIVIVKSRSKAYKAVNSKRWHKKGPLAEGQRNKDSLAGG